MRLAGLAVALLLFSTCKSADRSDGERPTLAPARGAVDLPAEAPLEEVMALPPEATPDMIEARLDRALELMDAMFETLIEHQDDCDRMARSLERFVEVNRAAIEQLKDLEGHKELLEERFKPKLDAWIQKWMPRLTGGLSKCFGDPRVSAVFNDLARSQ